MDTDVIMSYDAISRSCAKTKYSLDELKKILFNEVLPALMFNMYAFPAPEWLGFTIDCLVERILHKHQFGHPKPWLLRRYTEQHWQMIKPSIVAIQSTKNTSKGWSLNCLGCI